MLIFLIVYLIWSLLNSHFNLLPVHYVQYDVLSCEEEIVDSFFMLPKLSIFISLFLY